MPRRPDPIGPQDHPLLPHAAAFFLGVIVGMVLLSVLK